MDRCVEIRIPLFLSQVSKPNGTECHIWNGRKTKQGYGAFNWGGKQSLAHRFAYVLGHGSLPANSQLGSTCDNKLCVNPDHWFIDCAGLYSKMSANEFSDYFWSRVRCGGKDECWEWKAGRGARGYGVLGAGKAHRVAWELTNGKILGSLFVCHKCDNPPCCNPNHLFLGTCKDNLEDCSKKGRINCWLKKLTPDQVREIRGSNLPNSVLSKRFGIDVSGVYRIKKRINYKTVEDLS